MIIIYTIIIYRYTVDDSRTQRMIRRYILLLAISSLVLFVVGFIPLALNRVLIARLTIQQQQQQGRRGKEEIGRDTEIKSVLRIAQIISVCAGNIMCEWIVI